MLVDSIPEGNRKVRKRKQRVEEAIDTQGREEWEKTSHESKWRGLCGKTDTALWKDRYRP